MQPKAVTSFPGLCSAPVQGAAGGRGGVALEVGELLQSCTYPTCMGVCKTATLEESEMKVNVSRAKKLIQKDFFSCRYQMTEASS